MYVQSDTLLLIDVFENLRKIYELNPVKFLSSPGLAASKKTKVKLDLLTDIDVLLRQKKVLEQEYVTLLIAIKKLITNT